MTEICNPLYRWLEEHGVEYFHLFKYGRVALREGLRLLKAKSVLIPSYICSCIIPEIQKIGCDIRYYKINKDISIDFEDLAKKKADAVLVVDYFGFPADIEGVRKVVGDAYVVEDNAHGFLSEEGGKLLGTRGDIGISCMSKTFLVPDGAILYLNEESYISMGKPSSLSNCKTRVLSSSVGKRTPRRIRVLLNYTIPDNYEGEITHHSLEAMDRMNFVEVRNIRRRNYSMYLKFFGDVEVPFKDLGETISPWVFPFISKEKVFKSGTWANRKDVRILPVDGGIRK